LANTTGSSYYSLSSLGKGLSSSPVPGLFPPEVLNPPSLPLHVLAAGKVIAYTVTISQSLVYVL